MSDNNKHILVGTYGAEIYELTTEDTQYNRSSKWSGRQIMSSHYSPNLDSTNEIWGMEVYKGEKKDQFITVSDDATLRVWSSRERKQVKCI